MQLDFNLLENKENNKARPRARLASVLELPILKGKFKQKKVAFTCEMVTNCVQHRYCRSQQDLCLNGQQEKQNSQAFTVQKEEKNTVLGAGTEGQKCPFIQKKKKKKKFYKHALNCQWGQSNFDMKFFRILRHFQIKSINLTHISHWTLVAFINVSLPVSYRERD